MTNIVIAVPLTTEAFAPYGDVIEISGTPDKIINQGLCGRYHNLAKLDFTDGGAGISVFNSEPRHFPYTVELVERHPAGSQTFIPINQVSILVIVADDESGQPVNLKAFISGPGQSINLHRGVWHGVLAPIDEPGQYVVVDRIGDGANLEEHWFDPPYIVERHEF